MSGQVVLDWISIGRFLHFLVFASGIENVAAAATKIDDLDVVVISICQWQNNENLNSIRDWYTLPSTTKKGVDDRRNFVSQIEKVSSRSLQTVVGKIVFKRK